MSRLPRLRPEQLSREQRDVYASIVDGRGRAQFGSMNDDDSLAGPFNAMLFAPAVGDALQRLGSVIRYGTGLRDRDRELAILMVAARCDSAYERYAHERVARKVGVAEEDLASVRERRVVSTDDPKEAATWAVVRALVDDGDLDDASWESALETLGAETLVELTTLVGYYWTLALQLRVFRVVPPDAEVGDDHRASSC